MYTYAPDVRARPACPFCLSGRSQSLYAISFSGCIWKSDRRVTVVKRPATDITNRTRSSCVRTCVHVPSACSVRSGAGKYRRSTKREVVRDCARCSQNIPRTRIRARPLHFAAIAGSAAACQDANGVVVLLLLLLLLLFL